MVVTCGDTECQYYINQSCTAPAVHLTTDRFCTTGRRKQPPIKYRQMMKSNEPKGYKRAGKYVSN